MYLGLNIITNPIPRGWSEKASYPVTIVFSTILKENVL
jgi:hypothetical protein